MDTKPNDDLGQSLELIGSLLQHLDEDCQKVEQQLCEELKKLKQHLKKQILQQPLKDNEQQIQRKHQEEEQFRELLKLEEELQKTTQQQVEEHLKQRLRQEQEHMKERQQRIEKLLKQQQNLEIMLLKERQDFEEKQRQLGENKRWQELLREQPGDRPQEDDEQIRLWIQCDKKQHEKRLHLEKEHKTKREFIQKKQKFQIKMLEIKHKIQRQKLLETQAKEQIQLEDEEQRQWQRLEEDLKRQRQKLEEDQHEKLLQLKEKQKRQRQQLGDIMKRLVVMEVSVSNMIGSLLAEIMDLLASFLLPVNAEQLSSQEIHEKSTGNEVYYILDNFSQTYTLQTDRRAPQMQNFEQAVEEILRKGRYSGPQNLTVSVYVSKKSTVGRNSLKSATREKYEEASRSVKISDVKVDDDVENSCREIIITKILSSDDMDTVVPHIGEGDDHGKKDAVNSRVEGEVGAQVANINFTDRNPIEEEKNKITKTVKKHVGNENEMNEMCSKEKIWRLRDFFSFAFLVFLFSYLYIYLKDY